MYLDYFIRRSESKTMSEKKKLLLVRFSCKFFFMHELTHIRYAYFEF